MGIDGVRVFDTATGAVTTLPLVQIDSINTNHAVSGAVRWGVGGVLVGLLAGGLVGTLGAYDSCENAVDNCISPNVSYAILGSLIAGGLGAAIGAFRGHGPIWKFR